MPLDQQNTPNQTGNLKETQLAQATDAEAIGSVNVVAGRVEVVRTDGTRETLEEGMSIFQGDTIETGGNGTVGMVFVDDSTFSMSENGQMVIDEMVYDAGAQEGSAALNVVQGVFTLVSGEIAKTGVDAMVLETPTAVIGIRGTTFGGNIPGGDAPVEFVLLPNADGSAGEIAITNDAGVVIMSVPFTRSQIESATSIPSEPTVIPPEVAAQVFAAALAANAGSSSFNRQAVQDRSATLPDEPFEAQGDPNIDPDDETIDEDANFDEETADLPDGEEIIDGDVVGELEELPDDVVETDVFGEDFDDFGDDVLFGSEEEDNFFAEFFGLDDGGDEDLEDFLDDFLELILAELEDFAEEDDFFIEDDDDDDDQGITVVEADGVEVFGTAGADDIFGNSLNNTIFSSNGPDYIFGEGGTDTMTYASVFNGEGNDAGFSWDYISVVLGNYSVFLGDGTQRNDMNFQINKVYTAGDIDTGDFTNTVENFIGTSGNDFFSTYGGGFNFNGYTFEGASGNDTYTVEHLDTGSFTVLDDAGTDTFQTDGVTSLVNAYRSGDDLVLELGNEMEDEFTTTLTITASGHFNGNAIEYHENTDDSSFTMFATGLDASTGFTTDAIVVGTSADETITGSAFDDELFGGDGNDVINGGNGDDRINGGTGDNTIDGQGGTADEVTYHWLETAINATAITDGTWTVGHGSSQSATDTLSNIEHITGSSAGDTMNATGATAGITLEGLDGADNLTGSDHVDIIVGGFGNDILDGGLGADEFHFVGQSSGGATPGLKATVETLGTDTITADSSDVYVLFDEIFGLGSSGTLTLNTDLFATTVGPTSTAVDLNSTDGSAAGIVLVGASSGTDGVAAYYTEDLNAFSSDNSYQIAQLNGLNTGDLAGASFQLNSTNSGGGGL